MIQFKTCLNLATIGQLDFASQLKIASQAGYKAAGIRMNILQDYLNQGNTTAGAKQLLTVSGLDPVEMNAFPNWIFSPKNLQKETIARFEEFASVSEAIGCRIVVLPSAYEDSYPKDIGMAAENFQELCKMAARHKMQAALEFVPWSEAGTIKKAWEIVEQANQPNGGIVLDSFHYFEGKSMPADLEKVPIEKIFMVHLNDLKKADADLITLCRNYRVLPGEGIYNLDPLLKYLFTHNYQGYYNLELMYPEYGKLDQLVFATKTKQILDSLLEDFLKRQKV